MEKGYIKGIRETLQHMNRSSDDPDEHYHTYDLLRHIDVLKHVRKWALDEDNQTAADVITREIDLATQRYRSGDITEETSLEDRVRRVWRDVKQMGSTIWGARILAAARNGAFDEDDKKLAAEGVICADDQDLTGEYTDFGPKDPVLAYLSDRFYRNGVGADDVLEAAEVIRKIEFRRGDVSMRRQGPPINPPASDILRGLADPSGWKDRIEAAEIQGEFTAADKDIATSLVARSADDILDESKRAGGDPALADHVMRSLSEAFVLQVHQDKITAAADLLDCIVHYRVDAAKRQGLAQKQTDELSIKKQPDLRGR